MENEGHLMPTAPAAMLGKIRGTKKGEMRRSLPSAWGHACSRT